MCWESRITIKIKITISSAVIWLIVSGRSPGFMGQYLFLSAGRWERERKRERGGKRVRERGETERERKE
jgi:hypothetical protein